jgi:two-component system, NarL family, invasion response regulator UvrY
MIRVFIVDDHSIFREGVKRILDGCPDMKFAGESGNGRDALKKILQNEYEVILLDLSLPGMDGFDLLCAIKAKKPALPVLILSIYPEEDYAVRMHKEGASGYLNKESLPNELILAIRKAVRGKKYISDSLGEKLVGKEMSGMDKKKLHQNLTNREYQVFHMIATGKTVKEIAGELCLAPSTISTYRARILEKMYMKTNRDIIHYAIENGVDY